jgi:colanic acid biosynthesis glycosyl transferase WcaI
MDVPRKVIIVSQHYPPDATTTAGIMAEIARHVAEKHTVLVLSGTPGSGNVASQPMVLEIKNRRVLKSALIQRAAAELWFALRAFFMVLRKAKRGDVVIMVTAPFVLPYAVVAAAKLRQAKSVLIMHDLYPDVLVMAGLLKRTSLTTRAITVANAIMFRMLSAVVTIGRDTERLLLRHGGLKTDKIRFIPNWATLKPAVRPIASDNPFRPDGARFVVGLSGNLGFTHDPVVVFEAARLLRDEPKIQFLLSGWGVGFERLKQLQAEVNLPNVSLLDRVADEDLEAFLAAADVWLIPYRKQVAGVSVPSRFYNLLAVGRPVILVSEPEAEAALTVKDGNLGWIVPPGHPGELAKTAKIAFASVDAPMATRAVEAARNFNVERAMASYNRLIEELLLASERGRPA